MAAVTTLINYPVPTYPVMPGANAVWFTQQFRNISLAINSIETEIFNTATLQTATLSPAATSSIPGVMMGLGSTCNIKPKFSSRVLMNFSGYMSNTVGSDWVEAIARWGTGTPPVHGAAPTGTQIGTLSIGYNTLGSFGTLSSGGLITGLTPGLTYWFDLQVYVNAGSGSVVVSCSAIEL